MNGETRPGPRFAHATGTLPRPVEAWPLSEADYERLQAEAAADDFNPFCAPGEYEPPPGGNVRELHPGRATGAHVLRAAEHLPPHLEAESLEEQPLREAASREASSGASVEATSGGQLEASSSAGLRDLAGFDVEARDRARHAGRSGNLTTFEFVMWKLRVAFERGLVELAPVPREPLPVDALAAPRAVYEGFLLLLGLRWRDPRLAGQPAMFTLDFAAAWCGIREGEVREGRDWLRREGFMRAAGRMGRAHLWLPKGAA